MLHKKDDNDKFLQFSTVNKKNENKEERKWVPKKKKEKAIQTSQEDLHPQVHEEHADDPHPHPVFQKINMIEETINKNTRNKTTSKTIPQVPPQEDAQVQVQEPTETPKKYKEATFAAVKTWTDETKFKYVMGANANTKSAEKYDRYVKARTIGEAMKLGAGPEDLLYDFEQYLLQIQ